MADFFTRLAERTLGTVPVAQPLLTPMFAAPVPEAMPLNDIDFATDSEEATLAVQKLARPLTQTPMPSQPEVSPHLEPFSQSSAPQVETSIVATPPSATDALVETSHRIEPYPLIERREILQAEQENDEHVSNDVEVKEQTLYVETSNVSMSSIQSTISSEQKHGSSQSAPTFDNHLQPLVPSPMHNRDTTLPSPDDIQVSGEQFLETDIRQKRPLVQSQSVLPSTSSKLAHKAFVHEESVIVTPPFAQPLVATQGVSLTMTPQQREALTSTTVDGVHEIGDMREARGMIAAPRSSLSETDNLVAAEHVTHTHNKIVLEHTILAIQEEAIQQSQTVVTDAIAELQRQSVAAEHQERASITLVPQEHMARRQSEPPLREQMQAFPRQVPPHEAPTESVSQVPTIHISIGRIEVRAVTPTTASTRPKPRRAEPTLSLEDYLKQARGGRS